jgi:hypothetical protein
MANVSDFCTRAWSGLVGLMRHDFKPPSIGRFFSWVSVLGLLILAFIFGGVWVCLELPGTSFLERAVLGGKAFMERGTPPPAPKGGFRTAKPGVTRDLREKTFDGFTLITTTSHSGAKLVDMEGRAVHQWALPLSQAIPKPTVTKPLGDNKVHWYCCHLFANGDLLVLYQSVADTPPGFALVKLDKDSKLIWRYENNVHHSVDVGEDGRIYTFMNRVSMEPPRGFESIVRPFVDDYLVVLSPDGKELEKINLLEAYRDSPFALALSFLDSPAMPTASNAGAPRKGIRPNMIMAGKDGAAKIAPGKGPVVRRPYTPALLKGPRPGAAFPGDDLHPNYVRVLNSGLAAKFPMFRPNEVLISMRAISTIAVVNVEKRTIVWSAQGAWVAQHSPEFLENGHLLIYDNEGSPNGARVLEYEPQTGAIPWFYANENMPPFFAQWRGTAQRLPNGNTLIVDPDGMRIFEVTQDKESVWEMGCQSPADAAEDVKTESITRARRYAPSEITFLKGDVRARP